MIDTGFEMHMTPEEFQKYMKQHSFFAVEYRGDRQDFYIDGSASPSCALVRARFDFMYIVGNEIRLHCMSRECEMVLRNVELVVLAYMYERPLIFIECGDGDDIVCYDFSMITDDDMVNVFAPYDEADTPVKVTVR